jgi:hypothetical protein
MKLKPPSKAQGASVVWKKVLSSSVWPPGHACSVLGYTDVRDTILIPGFPAKCRALSPLIMREDKVLSQLFVRGSERQATWQIR